MTWVRLCWGNPFWLVLKRKPKGRPKPFGGVPYKKTHLTWQHTKPKTNIDGALIQQPTEKLPSRNPVSNARFGATLHQTLTLMTRDPTSCHQKWLVSSLFPLKPTNKGYHQKKMHPNKQLSVLVPRIQASAAYLPICPACRPVGKPGMAGGKQATRCLSRTWARDGELHGETKRTRGSE